MVRQQGGKQCEKIEDREGEQLLGGDIAIVFRVPQDMDRQTYELGTEGDCNPNGKATYSAWYEFVPAGPVTIRLAVRPGDRMTGAVLVTGPKVTVTLKNLTTRTAFSRTFASVAPLDTKRFPFGPKARPRGMASPPEPPVTKKPSGSPVAVKRKIPSDPVQATYTLPSGP